MIADIESIDFNCLFFTHSQTIATMDPYDSDSSGFEDEGDYTETGVVLGYASEEIIEDSVTHIGGWPVC